MELKQVIVVRADLQLPKGKLAAQVGHACVEAAHKSDRELYAAWRADGQKKVVLKIANEKELYKLMQDAKDSGITTALITDAGRTCIAPGTVTCCAFGPDDEKKLDDLTGKLSLL